MRLLPAAARARDAGSYPEPGTRAEAPGPVFTVRRRASFRRIARATASTPARGGIQASGAFMASRVAPEIAHQIAGTTISARRPLPLASRMMPSVATAVGSGATPKISTCRHPRPADR